jgi:hypothetical protein
MTPTKKMTNVPRCGVIIKLGTDGYTRSRDEFWCEECADAEMRKRLRQTGV